jgi:hypothetical protein
MPHDILPESVRCIEVFRADANLPHVPASSFARAFQIHPAIAQRMALRGERKLAVAFF